MDAQQQPRRVPVTIVCGALGSGKSTLLRHILVSCVGRKIAVIENEFGDGIGVEGLILKDGVEGAAADGFVELANGCVCCSVRGGLVLAIEALMERQGTPFDCILVEASGLASPGPVASIFWSDELGDDARVQLDSVVTVVDAAHLTAQLRERRAAGAIHEVVQQIAFADVVLLNKVDIATPAQVAASHRCIESINPGVNVLETTRSAAPLSRILDLAAFDVTRVLPESVTGRAAGHAAPADGVAASDAHSAANCNGGDAACVHDAVTSAGHTHDPEIATIVLRRDAPVSELSTFRLWVGSLLWREPSEDVRDGGYDCLDVAAVSTGVLAAHARGDPGVSASLTSPMVEVDDEPVPNLMPWTDDLVTHRAATTTLVMRGKGILYVAGAGGGESTGEEPVRHIFQAVAELFDVQPATGAAASAPDSGGTSSRIILIGRGLPADRLQAEFAALP